MPDNRRHRGQNPEDQKLFHSNNLQILIEAVKDLSYLLSKGYNMTSALKLVGDHFLLSSRQRIAIARSSNSDESVLRRKEKEVSESDCENRIILVDGYNILITIESALSGGLVFKSRDGCYRDISSIHGTYKRVEETIPALDIIRKNLCRLNPNKVIWYLDSPISNSGRLKQLILDSARENNCFWEVELVHNPDTCLKKREEIVITSDAIILNHVQRWFNLTKIIIEKDIWNVNLIDLSF